MYHGGFQHCGCCRGMYPPFLSPFPTSSSHHPSFLLLSPPPRCPDLAPTTVLSLLRRLVSPLPLRVGKGLNRPVQLTTRSTSNPRVSRVLSSAIFSRVDRQFCPRSKRRSFHGHSSHARRGDVVLSHRTYERLVLPVFSPSPSPLSFLFPQSFVRPVPRTFVPGSTRLAW